MSGARSFREIVVRDHARQHNGDAYHGNVSNTFNYNTYTSTSEEGSSRPRKRRRSSSSPERPDNHGMREQLMSSLYYDGFDYRKESLEGPQPQTFEWIFNPSGELILPKQNEYDHRSANERRLVWPSFPSWLESSDSSSQYCLIGKAGSGKSTLMAWISRDQQSKTISHLRKWAGSRPVHILSHFLFRPSGNALGRNLEGLLRSILYQVLDVLSELKPGLLAQYNVRIRRGHIHEWPVRVLKGMLKSILQSADGCVFCIFIDGVDELQEEGNATVDPSDLVAYLIEMQMPEHIKLCVSSRPTVNQLITLPSASTTTLHLTDLNRLDILVYVGHAISRCDGLREPDVLVREICTRADGVFLWAAFAVQEIRKWTSTEDTSTLLERLGKMGNQLGEIFTYMFGNIERGHHRTLAFYLKAMKWTRMRIIMDPPSVALLVAAQDDISGECYNSLVERCELEERRIKNWSHGLLEIHRPPSIYTPDPAIGSLAWIPRSSQHSEPGAQPRMLSAEESPSDWIISELDQHGQRFELSDRRTVSWLHRSAFDFFFSPVSRNHAQNLEELLGSYGDDEVTSALIRGHRRLMLTLPHPCSEPCFACMTWHFMQQVESIVHIAANAVLERGECHDGALDELLTTLLTFKHCGPHPKEALDYHWVLHDALLYEIGSLRCRSSLHPCVEDNCTIKLDLDRPKTHAIAANGAHDYIAGSVFEALFWSVGAFYGLSLSYIMQRCANFNELRAGGFLLALLLEGWHTAWFPGEMSSDETRFESHLLDQIEIWIEQHPPVSVPQLTRWIPIPNPGSIDPMFMSWSLRQAQNSDCMQDRFAARTLPRDHEADTFYEAWMLYALAKVQLRSHHGCCHRLNHVLSQWDIWLDVGGTMDVSVMIPLSEHGRENSMGPNENANNTCPVRLVLATQPMGRAVCHYTSSGIARTLFDRFKSRKNDEFAQLQQYDFLSEAEDLLRDVHQSQALTNIEKEAFTHAVCRSLVGKAGNIFLGSAKARRAEGQRLMVLYGLREIRPRHYYDDLLFATQP